MKKKCILSFIIIIMMLALNFANGNSLAANVYTVKKQYDSNGRLTSGEGEAGRVYEDKNGNIVFDFSNDYENNEGTDNPTDLTRTYSSYDDDFFNDIGDR